MIKSFRPALLGTALLLAAAPAFAQGSMQGGVSTAPTPSTQRPVAAAPATPSTPGGQVTQRPANGAAHQGAAQAPARPAQPSGSAATTPAPTTPRTN